MIPILPSAHPRCSPHGVAGPNRHLPHVYRWGIRWKMHADLTRPFSLARELIATATPESIGVEQRSSSNSAERIGILQPAQKLLIDLAWGSELEFVVKAVFRDLFGFGDTWASDGVIGADVQVDITLAGMHTGKANGAH